ncbi:MAG: TIGR04283 family arsenosugar biosynthesis glycosyltransferase [Candidatus Brocadiia bacterium]
MPESVLIVFTRWPEPGASKTRLIPVLGAAGAADLQRQMALHTISHAREVARRERVALEVRFSGGAADRMQEWLGGGMDCRPQGEGDLGARMEVAFRDAFSRGAARVVLVGTDCPGLEAPVMRAALAALRRKDLVLGPATDGGYWLIGLRRPAPGLFADMPWSTDSVLERTRDRARSLGLSVRLLEPLRDVDRPEDLPVWEEAKKRSPSRLSGANISVVIPTLNEAAQIADRVSELRDVGGIEVIVVDGGSADGTLDRALAAGARAYSSPQGRAQQMNLGAARAQSPILLFLHADTRLPEDFAESVRWTLSLEGIVAGAFELRIESPNRALRLIERLANARSRWLQMPYGDQALFLTAEAFRQSGGFPEIPLMEDFNFVRRLKRRGRIAIVPAPVLTSARRWMRRGVFRQTCLNQMLICGCLLGVSPSRLARWYGSSTGPRRG